MGWCQDRSATADLNGHDKAVYMELNKYLSLCENPYTARRVSEPPTYQWDAEDRMVSVDGGSTATQKYNALGQRVERFLPNGSWTFDYLFSAAGEELGLYSAGTAAWFDQNVPMGRRILVKYGSPLRILHANNLGTTTVVTDQTGAELGDLLYYPWGQAWTNTGLPYDRHFAGMQNFENPGLVYPTDFRKYNPALGRWMSPDPVGGDVTDPQSLNRYGYALNNPTTLTDPLGLDSSNPADPCSELGYYYSHAECGGPPPGSDCEEYDLGSCSGNPFPPLGGYGGGGAGSGGGTGSSASPAGQPPLAGMGNALFGGLITCTYAQVAIGGVLYPHGPTACILALMGIPGAIEGLLHSSWVTVSLTGAFPLGTPFVGLGPTVQGSLNVSTGQFCGGGGLALSFPAFPGRAASLGTLIHGNLSNATNILNHFSLSGSAQPSPFIGYQGVWNSSGVLGGPSVGVPGAQLAATYSGCGNLYSFLQNTF
jgi:RHS repeat-associated protein